MKLLRSVRSLAFLLFWLAPPSPALGQATQFLPTAPIPVDPLLRQGQLENGLRYYIRENSRPEERAELRLVVNAGSVLEGEDQRGLAHLVEHMAFNGTRNFERQELVNYLESIGMRFGPDLNAYTSFDETVYMLTIPTDNPEIVSTAFQILEDWAGGVLFEPAEIDKERGVVIEEWRGSRGAGARVQDQQLPVLLQGSRYADRLPIGKVETLESFPHDALTRFYREWYRPDLMAVIAVGDFEADQIEALIREHFGRIPRPATPLARTLYPVPGHAETLFHSTTDPELTLTQLQLVHKKDVERMTTVADYRKMLMERLYHSMLNARLGEITEKPNSPFLAAGSGGGPLVRTASAYSLQAIVSDGGVERGLNAVLLEAERVSRHGFTATELERTKTNMLRGLERAYIERERTNSSSHASEYVNNFLEQEPIPGISYEYQLAQTLFAGITVDELNQLGRELTAEENRVILVSAPEKPDVALPDLAALRRVMAAVEAAEVTPYEDTTVDQPLLATLPAPSPVVQETVHAPVDVTEWRLANGVRVLLKKTDFREDEVIFRAFSPGGSSLITNEEDYLSASIATSFAGVSGVGPFSSTDLRRVLTGKAASASPTIGELEEGFSGSASPRDLETMLQLVYLHFTAPRQDSEAIEAFLEQIRAVYANRSADPNAAFSDTFTVTINQYHPRSLPITPAELEDLDPDIAARFYRERFADASDFTFVFAGNLDIAAMKPLVERYLGGLPSTRRTETWRDIGIRPPTGVIEKVVRRGVEPRATTRIVFTGPVTFSREDAHLIRSLASVMTIRLREVLREDLGGTYGVSVGGSMSARPYGSYSLSVSFGSDPGRMEELVDALFADVELLKRDGPSEEDVASVREMQRRERETALRTNGFWLDQIVSLTRDGESLDRILEYDRLVESVTADRIRDAARRFFTENNYVRVTLVPATP